MAAIGDLFLRVLAEMTGFETEVTKGAEKAGDKAAGAMNKSLSKGLASAGAKALLTGFAGAAGLATKGILELEQVTADFRRETGATAEEAAAAGKAINSMAGRNIQPLEEVGRTLAKVHTDLGLTGDAAEQAAESFLKYGRATGRDAAEGVKALDDIMDAWNLDASKSTEIMDKLVVSHQKYGGSISENEQALSSLAPQLQALNLTIDDGIGLLNIFAASGLDASKAQFALNSAITKLPKGQTLEQFVAHIASIEDPAKRAREAIEVFGARGGAGLANALRPGRASLQDFTITTQESTGATLEAAEALDSTFGSKFKLLLKGAGAALIDFGSSFGPAVTGISSLATLGAAVGLDDFIAKFGPKLITAMKNAGKAGGEALSEGLISVWQGAGGTVVGNSIATRIETIIDSTKNSALGRVWRSAGDKAATIYLKALFMGDRLAAAMTAAIDALPVNARVKSVLMKVGGALGTTLGTAMGVAAALAIPVAVAAGVTILGDQFYTDQQKQIAKATEDAVTQGTTAGLEATARDLRSRIGQAQRAHVSGPMFEFLQEQLRIVEAKISNPSLSLGDAIGLGVGTGFGVGLRRQMNEEAPKVKTALDNVTKTKSAAQNHGLDAGRDYMSAFYRGVTEKQSIVQLALQQATQLSKTTMDKAKETQYLLGVLTSKEIARGVNDKRQDVAHAYRETVRLAVERLEKLAPQAGNLSKKSMDFLNAGLKSKIPEVREAAQTIVDRMGAKLNNAKAKGKDAGEKAGGGVVTGLNNKKTAIGNAAYRLGETIAKNVLSGVTHSVAFSQAHHTNPGKTSATGGPQQPDVPTLVGERGRELWVPQTYGHIIPNYQTEALLAADHGGGDTYNVNLLDRMPVQNVRDIGAGLKMLGDQGYFKRRRW